MSDLISAYDRDSTKLLQRERSPVAVPEVDRLLSRLVASKRTPSSL